MTRSAERELQREYSQAVESRKKCVRGAKRKHGWTAGLNFERRIEREP